ncbi:MAG: CoA-binding protein [Thermoplasmata archaeon]|nr:CoA-binding protein [Thermoplasmata archaeon]
MGLGPHDEIGEILEDHRTLAVVGLSTNPAKDAHQVPRFAQAAGYRIVPVNPHAEEILGEKAYPRLGDIPFPVDMVVVFRPSEEVPAVVDQVLETEAKAIWLQSGIRHDAAAQKAREAGLQVVQDRCIRTELILRGARRPP